MPTWVFVALKCWQNFKILQLAWTLTPNKSWTKCVRCLIFAQTKAFHLYFMQITTFISIWLQLKHNGSSHLLKNLSKLIFFLEILSYNYGFFKMTEMTLFLVKLYHFVAHYEARKEEQPIWSGKWDITA